MIEEIIGGVAMPLAMLIALVFFMILFRDRLETIEIDPLKRKIKAKFHKKVVAAERSAKGITATVAADRSVASSRSVTLSEPAQNHSMRKARDIVLGAWGSLKQILYDACAAKNIPMTPSTSPLEASAHLYQANWISSEVVALIDVLNELAQELAADTSIRPYPRDALIYANLANVVLSWMMINVLPAEDSVEELVEEVEEVPRHRRTVVSEDFRLPGPGSPTALLVGVDGPVRGRQYAIEQAQVQVGEDHGNDLLISNDDYVSANHAVLRYAQGSLFVSDLKSRNGTFLNENPVTSSAVLVRAGDRIRFGQSVFQVSATANPSITKEIPSTSNKSQVR